MTDQNRTRRVHPPALPLRPLRLLYLCHRETYDTKMSRVRFHGIEAIAARAEVTWSGPGWKGYDERRTVQENIDRIYRGAPGPDLVVAFKPLGLRGFADTLAPRCIRYNEMYDVEWTQREILESRANLVVCHHRNDMADWQQRFRGYRGHPLTFVNIAHCADARFYRDYGLEKRWDVLLVGAHGVQTALGAHYPLRDRMVGVLQRLQGRYRCEVHRHPGGELADAPSDRNTIQYARALNSAKICVTCSGAPRSRFGKYVEVPMSGSALAADLPAEDRAFFRQFMIEIDLSDSDDRILQTLAYWIEHDAERQLLVQRGLELSRLYTQEKYAQRFVRETRAFLARWHDGGLPSAFEPETMALDTDVFPAPPPPAPDDVLARVTDLLRKQQTDAAMDALDGARRRLPACRQIADAREQLRAALDPAAEVESAGWPAAATLRPAIEAAEQRRASGRSSPEPVAPAERPSTRPKIHLVADVPNWIFARHCRELATRLADEFEFSTGYHRQPFAEEDYDLVYALEWNCVEDVGIRNPEKFVAGIRGHVSWRHLPFEEFGEYLRARFQRVHVVSRRLQRLFEPIVPGVELVTHGVDTRHFRPPPTPPSRTGGRLRLGWAGNRRAHPKRYRQLVAPLADVPGVELVVCGLHHDNLGLDEMPAFYAGIDAYVCASRHEGSSNTIMEAAAMERAVITTDTGNAGEYLEDGVHAIFVEPSLPAVVAAVEHLRDHPDRRAELGQQARRAVVAHMDWDDHADDYRQFFRRALLALGIDSTPARDEALPALSSAPVPGS